VASVDWDIKTLMDNKLDADPVALIELEEQLMDPMLYYPFYK
jgi:hypothetical protein